MLCKALSTPPPPGPKGPLRFRSRANMILTFTCRPILHPELILFYESVIRFETKNPHGNFCFHLVVFKYNLAVGVWFKITLCG